MLTYCQKPKLALADKNRHVHHVDILLKGNTCTSRQKQTCPSCWHTVKRQHLLCQTKTHVHHVNKLSEHACLSSDCQNTHVHHVKKLSEANTISARLSGWQNVRSQRLLCQTNANIQHTDKLSEANACFVRNILHPPCWQTARGQHSLCHAVRPTNCQKPMLALSDKHMSNMLTNCQKPTPCQAVRPINCQKSTVLVPQSSRPCLSSWRNDTSGNIPFPKEAKQDKHNKSTWPFFLWSWNWRKKPGILIKQQQAWLL